MSLIYMSVCSGFQASNFDELTIAANEELELVADGDGEGWIKVRVGSFLL